MTIRNATEQDLDAILDIFNHEVIHTQYVYLYEPWSKEYINKWYQEKLENNFPLIVAAVNNEVVGYGTYGPFRQRAAYNSTVEYSVYIHKDHRRKGYARQLVETLIGIAKEQGRHCMIGGLDAGNQTSYDFHISLGFTPVAHIKEVARKFDKWLDLIFFQKILGE